jgi:hypothetical protein
MQHQVLREALGGVLAFDAETREIDLTKAWIVMSNDAVGALSALRKGCASSTFLQQCAMRLARLQREVRCHERHALFLHTPGDQLIEEGIDTLSHDDDAEVAGPASSPTPPPPDSDAIGELAIFTVDFTLWSPRCRTSSPARPCGLDALFRGRDPLGSLVDQDEPPAL